MPPDLVDLIFEFYIGIGLSDILKKCRTTPSHVIKILKMSNLFVVQYVTQNVDIDLLQILFEYYKKYSHPYASDNLKYYIPITIDILNYLISIRVPSQSQLLCMFNHIQEDQYIPEHKLISTLLLKTMDYESMTSLCSRSVSRGMNHGQFKFVEYLLTEYNATLNRTWNLLQRFNLPVSLINVIIENHIPVERYYIDVARFCTICKQTLIRCKCIFSTYDGKKYLIST